METETKTIETAITFPGEQYVQRGVYSTTCKSTVEWADTFAALGGESAGVRPAWALGMEPGSVTVIFRGTQAALDYLLAGLTD